MLHIITSNHLFFLDAFVLYIVLFLLAHILVLFKTLTFLNILRCQITFVVVLSAIAKPYESLSGSFRLSPVRKQTLQVSGLRWEPTLKVRQTIRLIAGFRCIFPFAPIHFHALLQMTLQQYTQGYPARYTRGSASSKAVRSSGLQAKLKFWPGSETEALGSGAALANVERLATVESSGQQTTHPPSFQT